MVDDKVRHYFMRFTEGSYIIPITKAGVDFRVICRVEASIGSVDGMKKGKQVHAAKHAGEGAAEQGFQFSRDPRTGGRRK